MPYLVFGPVDSGWLGRHFSDVAWRNKRWQKSRCLKFDTFFREKNTFYSFSCCKSSSFRANRLIRLMVWQGLVIGAERVEFFVDLPSETEQAQLSSESADQDAIIQMNPNDTVAGFQCKNIS